jgi:hypothetical protein
LITPFTLKSSSLAPDFSPLRAVSEAKQMQGRLNEAGTGLRENRSGVMDGVATQGLGRRSASPRFRAPFPQEPKQWRRRGDAKATTEFGRSRWTRPPAGEDSSNPREKTAGMAGAKNDAKRRRPPKASSSISQLSASAAEWKQGRRQSE